jgi:UPF0755 protein
MTDQVSDKTRAGDGSLPEPNVPSMPAASAASGEAKPSQQAAAGAQPILVATRPPEDAPRISPKSPRAAIEPDAAPPRPKRSVSARGRWVVVFNGIFSFLLILSLAGGLGLYYGRLTFYAPGPLERDRVVNIPRGSAIGDIAAILKRDGVIEDTLLLTVGSLIYSPNDRPRAGEYLFPARSSARQVSDILISGRVVEHSVTIPEGLTSQQIVARLMDFDVLVGEVRTTPPEGSLLPDTYRVVRGTTRDDLLRRMANERNQVVQRAWSRRIQNLPVRTPEEMVILASIVEKETGKGDERARVAGVFVNRLNRRMRLQSDPTIIYGLVGGQGTLGRPILASEITRPTPFNTYVIDGLPPTPIANPGRAAIEAVANPMRSGELFFVADGTGGHAFAETYAEHLQNVARWRQIERERGAAAGQGPRGQVNTPAPVVAPVVAPVAQPTRPGAPSTPQRPQAGAGQVSPNAVVQPQTGIGSGTQQAPRRIDSQPSTPRQ